MKTPLNQLKDEIIKTLNYMEGLNDEYNEGIRTAYNIVLDKIEDDLIDEEKIIIEDAVTYGNRQNKYDTTEMLGKHYYKELLK